MCHGVARDIYFYKTPRLEKNMKIHTVERGETLSSIAEGYGIPTEILARINGLREREPLVLGEELAVILPTRTYKVSRGDTPERISLRFGIRKWELYALNPYIKDRGFSTGETLILRIAEPPSSAMASGGVLYRGTSEANLRIALPYLTYVSVSEAVVNDGKIKRLFDSGPALKIIRESGKIPLMRITDSGTGEKYKTADSRSSFISELVALAKNRDYKGVTLAVGSTSRGNDECFAEFLMELRRKMIGEDLILITECDEKSPSYLCELSDGAIFSYDRCAADTEGSFEDCERASALAFANESESSKSFLDLPPFALWGNEYITWDEALSRARRACAKIKTDEKTLLSSYEYRGEKTVFPSLKNIKARLELASELGFMGISFDIMRTPIRHLYSFGACYRSVNYTGLTSREGCSRES